MISSWTINYGSEYVLPNRQAMGRRTLLWQRVKSLVLRANFFGGWWNHPLGIVSSICLTWAWPTLWWHQMRYLGWMSALTSMMPESTGCSIKSRTRDWHSRCHTLICLIFEWYTLHKLNCSKQRAGNRKVVSSLYIIKT